MADTNPNRIAFDGLIAAVIGYATVAATIAGVNVAEGRSPFFTAALLGELLFYGRGDAVGLDVTPGPVFAFNGIYLAVCVGIGLIAAWIVNLGAGLAQYWYLLAVLVLFVGAKLVAGLLILVPREIAAAVPAWAAVVGAAGAIVSMGAYLAITNPELRAGARVHRD